MALYYGVGRGPGLIPLSFSPTAAGEALPASRPLRRLIRPQRAPIIPRRKPGGGAGRGSGGERPARARAIDLVDEVKSGHAGSPGGGGGGDRDGEGVGAGPAREGAGRPNKTGRTKPHNKTEPRARGSQTPVGC